MYCGRVVERGDCKNNFRQSVPPVYEGTAGIDSETGRRRKRTEVDSGKCSEPEIYAERLQICAAMSIRFGKMPRGRTGDFSRSEEGHISRCWLCESGQLKTDHVEKAGD